MQSPTFAFMPHDLLRVDREHALEVVGVLLSVSPSIRSAVPLAALRAARRGVCLAGQRCKTRPVAAAISISGLVKTFGTTRALDGLDLVVETGEVHGFLGPNGSGKTTTIRVLLGLLRADRGEVSCSAATRGATRSRCTAASRTCRATSRCGRSSAAAR